jgi:signal transduction histidine kinase
MDMTLDRLSTLVEDLLNVSRLEQNRLPIDVKPTELREDASTDRDRFFRACRGNNLSNSHMMRQLSRREAYPRGSGTRTKQILVNLLSNAVKYTKKGSITLVRGGERGTGDDHNRRGYRYWYFRRGYGASLFGKFYRVRNVDTEKIPGTGLGLWIAREIARKMGGDLTLESMQGVGSHFNLRLKKAKTSS